MSPEGMVGSTPEQKNISVKSFFEALNWVEVVFGIVGAAALYYTIYYYRYKLQADKLSNNNLQNQIDTINMHLSSAQTNQQQPVNNGNFTG